MGTGFKPPRFLHLVNQDLRGELSRSEAQELADAPAEWLAALLSICHSVQEQLDERSAALDRDLMSPEPQGGAYELRLAEHRGWRRKAEHVLRRARRRISHVRTLLPPTDYRALLLEGIEIPSGDWAALLEWQQRARLATGI